MNSLIENHTLKELKYENNFEYILESDVNFVNIDYKVLQSQTDGIFVECYKIKRNNKISLLYITDDYKPLNLIFENIEVDTLITIFINLFSNILEVKSNGFLSCQNIDISWDKIFLEQSTFKIKLVYLPISKKIFDSKAEFESEFRSNIVKLIEKKVVNTNERLDKLLKDLSNGLMSLEEIYNQLKNNNNQVIVNTNNNINNQSKPTFIKLVAMNSPTYFEIIINANKLILGKKQELVDITIPYNNMISRKHCVITNDGLNYFIQDLCSANGTYVNQVRLSQGQQMQINKGDIIRLANSDFQVV